MTVLVTGVSGLIGGQVAELLRARDETVVGYDLRPPADARLRDLTCVVGDLNDHPRLFGAFKQQGVRKVVHDFLTVGAPAPLQAAAVTALNLPDQYYSDLLAGYRERRDLMLEILRGVGFDPIVPHGAYYCMADIRPFTQDDDVTFARHLIKEVGVGVVPGSSFYHDPSRGRTKIRFCFAKRHETLNRAGELLATLRR